MKSLYKAVKLLAIVLWLVFIITIVVATLNNHIWDLMPIIAHNHIQNWLGWDLVLAVIASVCSFILRLMV